MKIHRLDIQINNNEIIFATSVGDTLVRCFDIYNKNVLVNDFDNCNFKLNLLLPTGERVGCFKSVTAVNGALMVTFPEQTTSFPGVVQGEIVILRNGTRTTTSRFFFEVRNTFISGMG